MGFPCANYLGCCKARRHAEFDSERGQRQWLLSCPAKPIEFARALGFASRSKLQSNGRGLALTSSNQRRRNPIDLPWKDCEALVGSTPNQIFWHHWPDAKLHDGSGAGQGLEPLTKDVAEQLSGDDFWSFVERIATGRRLVITSDHGYAATGYFPDADGEVGQFLKKTFSSGRSKLGTADTGPFRAARCITDQQSRTARICWPWAAGSGVARAVIRRSPMVAYRCWKCCRPSLS